MAFDPRQVLAAFLTLSMFAMLGNMIKRDHFDTVEVRIPLSSSVKFDVIKVEQPRVNVVNKIVGGPWGEAVQELKTCWNKPTAKEIDQSGGFVTFSLTGGTEHHVSQVADAVVIARHLGATLVLPDIRGSELGQKRNFEDMYDIAKFIGSLDGVIKIVDQLPAESAAEKPAVIRVPHRVTPEFIVKNIEPTFRTRRYVKIVTFFPLLNMKMGGKLKNVLDSTACVAMFGSLELKQSIREVAETMIVKMRTSIDTSEGRFVAVDLRLDVLEKKGCKRSSGRKICYTAREVADFLKRIGFNGETTIYLTQTWWHDSLSALKEIFPYTYTKDDIIPADKKGKFLGSGSSDLARALDFYVCSQSDVFVPAIPGLFYAQVAGKRIASGKTRILVPSEITTSSARLSDHLSSYVSKKNHLAYSCYC